MFRFGARTAWEGTDEEARPAARRRRRAARRRPCRGARTPRGWRSARHPAPTQRRALAARRSDLAVLKIDAGNLPSLPLRGGAVVKQGELVVPVGSPQGLATTMTMDVL